jgi:DNA-binding NarL/FixJ family response regulator
MLPAFPIVHERALKIVVMSISVRVDSPRATQASRDAFPELTDREREILDLVTAGRNNQEIAEGLYLSLKTVGNYVSNVFTKLQVADRAQATVRAREAGLGRGGERPQRRGTGRPVRGR